MEDGSDGRAEAERGGPLVAFYRGRRPDSSGRMIEHVWAFDDEGLEHVHDYIQWLFPLRELSRFNVYAPTLDDEAVGAFLADARLRARLLRSLELMLRFYGFSLDESAGEVKIAKSPDYAEKKRNWLTPYNHNYLRLTRIIKCLGLLGLGAHARALFECLGHVYQEEGARIGSQTFAYWKDAASV